MDFGRVLPKFALLRSLYVTFVTLISGDHHLFS